MVPDVQTYKLLERIQVDPEFSALIAPPDPDELALLEAAIRRDGIRDPLSVWIDGGTVILLDGHTRLRIAQTLGMAEVPVHYVKLPDRDAALLWIEENQAGRRNLTDDQRSMIWASILERRAKASRSAAAVAREAAKREPIPQEVILTPRATDPVPVEPPADMAEALAPKKRARAEVAKESGLPERKLRAAAKLRKENPAAAEKVRAGKKTMRQIKKELHALRVQATKNERLGKSEGWRFRQIDSLVGRLYGVLPSDQRDQEIFRMLQHMFDSYLLPDYKLPDGAPRHIEGFSNAKDDHTPRVKSAAPKPQVQAPTAPPDGLDAEDKVNRKTKAAAKRERIADASAAVAALPAPVEAPELPTELDEAEKVGDPS